MELFFLNINYFFLNKPFFFLFFTFINIIFYYLHGINSTFEGVNSDQEKQIKVSNEYYKWWPWPSNMHNFSDKVAMKDVGIIVLTVFKKILKINKDYRLLVLIANFAHLFSFVVVYLIVEKIFTTNTAIIISVIYFFSTWSYLIILHAGFQLLGQLFFLISIYCLLFADLLNISSLYFSFLSGFIFGVSNFSSASSRKYIPVYFIFVSYYFFDFYEINFLDFNFFIIFKLLISSMFILVLFFHLYSIFFTKRISINIVKILFKLSIFKNNDDAKQNVYVNKIENFINYTAFPILSFNLFVIFSVLFSKNFLNLSSLFFIICGILSSLFIFTYPNFKKSINAFFYYWTLENLTGSHFKLYDKYFMNKYKFIYNKNHKRFYLLFRIYFRIMPSLIILSLITFVVFFYKMPFYNLDYLKVFLVFVLTFSPLIWSEITGGPKAILPLYNTYITFLLPLSILINIVILKEPNALITIIYPLLFLYIFYNLFVFYNDLYPSRIHIHKIKKYLLKNNIKKLYSYKNEYSRDTIALLVNELNNTTEIVYIKSISEIENGFFLQPPLTNKSAYHQSSKIGSSIHSFNEDLEILKLFENNSIDKFTMIKFKNRATSKLWQLTGNVIAFRDLILNEINKEEIFKSYVRLIKVDKKFLKNSRII